jgi:hypothetical protein
MAAPVPGQPNTERDSGDGYHGAMAKTIAHRMGMIWEVSNHRTSFLAYLVHPRQPLLKYFLVHHILF